MNIRAHRFTSTIIVCGFALSITACAAADTITLKTAARQRGDSAVIALGDIAVLEGEEALRLANVQVATIKPSAAAKPIEIDVNDVRRAPEAAGINWAKVNLSGRSVIVRPARAGDALPPQAMSAVALEETKPDAAPAVASPNRDSVTLDSIIAETTLRGSIASLIISNLRVDPRDLRVRINPDDAALLNTSLAAGQLEVQPLGSLAGDRLAFAIRSWNGNAVESKGQITLIAERQVQVTRTTRDLSRGATAAESDLETTSAWVSPSEAMQAAPPAAIVGRNVTRMLKAGEMIRTRDVEREALIKRGDLVVVRCLVGGVAISLQAEARADGSLGDSIEFRKNGEREAFLATITAKGEAVVDLTRK